MKGPKFEESYFIRIIHHLVLRHNNTATYLHDLKELRHVILKIHFDSRMLHTSRLKGIFILSLLIFCQIILHLAALLAHDNVDELAELFLGVVA